MHKYISAHIPWFKYSGDFFSFFWSLVVMFFVSNKCVPIDVMLIKLFFRGRQNVAATRVQQSIGLWLSKRNSCIILSRNVCGHCSQKLIKLRSDFRSAKRVNVNVVFKKLQFYVYFDVHGIMWWRCFYR